ncbi:MAG: hypothetical protein AAGJ81_08270 [Verrucomicrobiota bacterium]
MGNYFVDRGETNLEVSEADLFAGVKAGMYGPEESVCLEGWSEWKPLGEVFPKWFEKEAVSKTPAAAEKEVKTNVKQTALVGAFACAFVGVFAMWASVLMFWIYVPLLGVSAVLAVVAMVQGRVLGGLLLFLVLLVGVPVVWFVQAAGEAQEIGQSILTQLEENQASKEAMVEERKARWSVREEVDEMDGAKEFWFTRNSEDSSVFNESKLTISVDPENIWIDLSDFDDFGVDVRGGDGPIVTVGAGSYGMTDEEKVQVLKMMISNDVFFVRPSYAGAGSEKFAVNGLKEVLFPALKETGQVEVLKRLY